MRKLTMTSILVLTFICPAISEVNVDIAANANNPGCTNSVLQTYTGPTQLEAEYSPNTINLKWYGADGEITSVPNASKTCTYDGSITLPTTNPTRTGYTFAGWQVRVASNNNNNQTPITLSSLYSDGDTEGFLSKSLNPGVFCEGQSVVYEWEDLEEEYVRDSIPYGTEEGGSCSDSAFTGLNNGEWRVTMPNGSVVKGVSTCSTEHPTTPWYNNNKTFTTDHFSTTLTANQYSTDEESGMQYCWCKATSADSGNGYQPVSSSSWVFYLDESHADDCANDCANDCAFEIAAYDEFRAAVFGVTE